MNNRSKTARSIQSEINEILYRYWDPIGMNDVLPKDEYAAYVGSVYRALAYGKREPQIVDLLTELEANFGCRAALADKRETARKLCALDLSLVGRA